MKKHVGIIVTVVIIVLAIAVTVGMIVSTLLGSQGDSEGTSAGYVYDVFSADSGSASLLSWERASVPVAPLTACPARSLTLTATDAPFAPVRLKVTLNPDCVCARSVAASASSKQHSEVRKTFFMMF